MKAISITFYHTILGDSVMRSDLKAKDVVTAELKEVISNATSATKVGSASFQISSGTEIYMIDLNFPLELNPVYKYKPSGNDAEYYKYYGMGCMWLYVHDPVVRRLRKLGTWNLHASHNLLCCLGGRVGSRSSRGDSMLGRPGSGSE